MGEFIMRHIPIEAPVYIYRNTMSDFNYYARRETIPVLTSTEAIEKAALGQVAYLLINEKDLKKLHLEPPQRILTEHQLGERKWYLVKLSRAGL